MGLIVLQVKELLRGDYYNQLDMLNVFFYQEGSYNEALKWYKHYSKSICCKRYKNLPQILHFRN